MRQYPQQISTYDSLMLPTIKALQALGGSGTIEEIYEKVVEILALPNSLLEVLHADTAQSEIEYRLAWSRTYLKQYGILENSTRGVWAISPTATDLDSLDPKEIGRVIRESHRARSNGKSSDSTPTIALDNSNDADETADWREQIHKILLSLQPASFERLAQRLLRESGFIQVEVTGRSGDGGIDGIGIARINGFLSFHVLFQCKRYQGAITPSQVRDFRGAMQGRTDKGLFLTTGTFTPARPRDVAQEEQFERLSCQRKPPLNTSQCNRPAA